MRPDLLNYIDDVINERLTLLHEREIDPTWKDESEDFKKDYLKGEYFYDKDSYYNGEYISKKEVDLEKIRLLYIYEDVIGNLIFDTEKLKFISINDI